MDLGRFRTHLQEFGAATVAVAAGRRAGRDLAHRVRGWTGRPPRTVTYGGRTHPEFHHPDGRTWLTERAVEVAVARAFLDRAPLGARVLEVGNVLGRYGGTGHLVIDRYERAPGVLNVDAADYAAPELAFDAIVSVSTLEHVGWDEPERDLGKAERTIAHLRRLLAPGGRMLVTIPLGYHPALDTWILGGAHDADHAEIVRRARGGGWEPVGVADLGKPRYEFDARTARAVWIAEFTPVA